MTYEGNAINQGCPDSSVTRYYNFDVARARLSPDGFEKEMIVINGQYPGPLIEANWGDWISVNVTNSIRDPEEGTAIHWHAFLQQETPWYDGVPSVQQCPIAPGSSFTYTFRADHVGTSFYHSHYSAQIAAGASGPIVIHGPQHQEFDYDMGPVLVSDWFHEEYHSIIEGVTGTDPSRFLPAVSNNLINGKMNFDCTTVTDGTPCVSDAGISKFVFHENSTHLLRIINGGSSGTEYFSVDEHNMTVVSMDFIPIEPYETNVIALGVGQRTEVIVRGKSGADAERAYFMRANLLGNCTVSERLPMALAAIYYNDEDAENEIVPDSEEQEFDAERFACGNEPLELTRPIEPMAVTALEPETTVRIELRRELNATGHQEWLMNGQTFRGNFNHPILGLASQGNVSYPYDPQWNVYNMGSNHTVRVIWENNNDPEDNIAHPMHLHGHDFQVLSAGPGEWDGTIINPENPLRRDTHILPPGGHLVTQFQADNPGIWPYHCHIAWHVSSGFYVNIMERPDDLLHRPEIPRVVDETCRDWNEWSRHNIVSQIDSGVKAKAKSRIRMMRHEQAGKQFHW
ncbi:hypothetical protein DL764_008955 [Monosporascus ibericus]|uniref:Laccase n=1 Tax=Monosporascus ibericus TaxID=155417 RepID=A0A4Q4SZ69_9PEZI|nr:hypothetical protein DL764_008955 [Monosporascus ibericus]